MSPIQVDLQRLPEYLICPVSQKPLTEAVSLIPCFHKVNRVVAKEIFGKTNEALGKTNERWRIQSGELRLCPVCSDHVLGYAKDYTIRDIVAQVLEVIKKANLDDDEENLDKALEVAEAIADDLKNKALMRNFDKFLEENPDRALELAKAINDDDSLENKALMKNFNKFLEENPDIALELANAIINENKALMEVVNNFLEGENLDKALEVAKAINDDYWRCEAFMAISNKCLGNANKVMINKYDLNTILINFVNKFLGVGNLDKALEVAKSINDNYYLNKALKKVVNKFLEVGNLDKALEIAKGITDNYYLHIALMKVVNKFLEEENPDRALEVAKGITDNYDLNKALKKVVNKFLEKGNPDKALEVAKGITNNYCLHKALMKVVNKFLEEENQIKL